LEIFLNLWRGFGLSEWFLGTLTYFLLLLLLLTVWWRRWRCDVCSGHDARRRVVQPQSQRSTNEQLAPITSKLYAPVSNIDIYCTCTVSGGSTCVQKQ